MIGEAADFIELPEPWPGAPKAFLSLRAAGDMGVRDPSNDDRRAAWLRARGFEPSMVAIPDMSHSRVVAAVSRPVDGERPAADGLVCAGLDPGSCLLVTVADCMPIFLYDRGTGAFGVLHSGWKGTGILAVGIAEMRDRFGSRPADLAVTLGPSIGACCYSVDDGRAAAFEAEFGKDAVSRDGKAPRLDLVAANLSIAEAAGVGSILTAASCTVCDEQFGSFRREKLSEFARTAAAEIARTAAAEIARTAASGFTRMAAVVGRPRMVA